MSSGRQGQGPVQGRGLDLRSCSGDPLWKEWLTDRHDWKYYLPATSWAGGRKLQQNTGKRATFMQKKLRLCANKNSMDVKWISFECFIITENYETINFMITHFIGNLLFTRVNCWDFGKLAIKHNNTQVSEIEIQRAYAIINYCPHPLPPRAGGRVLQGAEPSCLIDVHPALKHR